MTLCLFNTLTQRKEPLVPLTPGRATLYLCGPTVYDDPHLGHARSAVIFDVMVRYLKVKGFDVTYIRNVTDIDDKIFARARCRDQDFRTLADHFLHRYHLALARMNVRPPDVEPRASDYLLPMCDCISALVQKGHAYLSGGDVYFSVASFKGYGRLSGRSIGQIQGSQENVGDGKKKHPADFALWKAAKPEEPSWQSPWGAGRPGWHIECSAMSARLLGEVSDIHGGGTDLIFPHHENEIAQSAGISGKTPARYWIHNGLVNMGAEKMSKSRGNYPSLFDLLDAYPADALRLLVLSKRYRHPLAYSDRAAHTAVCQLKRLQRFFDGWPLSGGRPSDMDRGGTLLWKQFCSAMDDDFNFPQALSVIFRGIKSCRRLPGNELRRTAGDAEAVYGDLVKMCRIVLGLSLEPATGRQVAPPYFHQPAAVV